MRQNGKGCDLGTGAGGGGNGDEPCRGLRQGENPFRAVNGGAAPQRKDGIRFGFVKPPHTLRDQRERWFASDLVENLHLRVRKVGDNLLGRAVFCKKGIRDQENALCAQGFQSLQGIFPKV